jgi:hypothetical protein
MEGLRNQGQRCCEGGQPKAELGTNHHEVLVNDKDHRHNSISNDNSGMMQEYFTHRYMSVGSTHLYPYPYPYLYPSTQRVEVLTL